MADVDPILAMRRRVDAIEAALWADAPEGTMLHACGDAGIALRRLGIEVLVALHIPQMCDWLSRWLSRRR